MTSDGVYSFVKDLPFADGSFKTTPKVKEPVITFSLAKDPARKVTLFNIHDHAIVPANLIQVIEDEFNYVVEEGRTYPYNNKFHGEAFIKYWFTHFASILIEGEHDSFESLQTLSTDQWHEIFLGTFYVKPNYVGRCSHVCNAGFMVNHTKRGLGLGRELGQKYLQAAPELGYVYSVFNLVFETNVASLKIWDSLGFERIGYVKNVAVLKGEDRLVGAFMFGKDLQ
ncbi:L-azetidine-2-carboxylic acid acetyltransferase [Candida viswanathii]|uniref:L-azetidine-2-carboxylic acid acetyltransferase n=1 Tax=Candida viswanathii TaxID=5486 RepID=A0A367XYW2_9ASCO|nr:L-azetidine-2-carboxylic acid acetyltransferase [Candida viswanathii]